MSQSYLSPNAAEQSDRDSFDTSTHSEPGPAPSHELWALHEVYSNDLPTTLHFDPGHGFGQLQAWIRKTAEEHLAAENSINVCPLVVAYKDGKQKTSWVAAGEATAEQREEAGACVTLSAFNKAWRAAGSVGVVVSCMDNAPELSTLDTSNWHAVAVAQQGDTVWIHDPAYNSLDYAEQEKPRMDRVHGTRLVHLLVKEWKSVKHIWLQGPEPEHQVALGDGLQCMGRSAQWIEATLDGTLPWPPNGPNGGRWTEHRKN